MVETEQYIGWLILWLLGLVVVLWSQKERMTGVGLTLAYALQLWVIHWLAAAIYALPWYRRPTPLLLAGLQESALAVLGFALGCALLPFLLRLWRSAPEGKEASAPEERADPRLMRVFIAAGVGAYITLPFVQTVPTVGAIVSVAANLLLVAFAMECWNSIHDPKSSIWRWIALSALLPFITIITQGFLSYGFAAMLTVFAFVASMYRPRWKVLVFGLVASYLALSVYVTYMRDRMLIREAVWGQKSYETRLNEMTHTFGDFELLDLRRIEHLERIDDRLNQNGLVGAAVMYLAATPQDFARGSTLWEAALSPIPRALWPDKPIVAGSGELVTRFTGIKFAEGTSVGIGHVLEWYVNFGPAGVVIGSMLMGLLLGFIDRTAAVRLQVGDWQAFAAWYLPALSLLQVGGSLVEAVSGAATGLLIGAAILRLKLGGIRPDAVPSPSPAPAVPTLRRRVQRERPSPIR